MRIFGKMKYFLDKTDISYVQYEEAHVCKSIRELRYLQSSGIKLKKYVESLPLSELLNRLVDIPLLSMNWKNVPSSVLVCPIF